MASVMLSYEQFERLFQALDGVAADTESAVNEALKGSQVKNWMINSITGLTPVSKVKTSAWHPRHAKSSSPYKESFENLSILIKSKTAFNYLYFPDDGSNTKRHQGMQQFMLHGMEEVTDQVIDEIAKKIIEKISWN